MERATVRLEDVNGPKGGIDSACRIKLVLAGRPSVLIEKRAASYDVAFAQAVRSVGSALQRTRAKHQLHGSRRGEPVKPRSAKPTEGVLDVGELIGRRVGRDAKAGAARAPSSARSMRRR
ncbi:MAG: hypothetical protein ABI704_10565 [Kofleriaceae bacterium]